MLRLLADRRVLLSMLVIGSLIAVALWPRAVVVDVAEKDAWQSNLTVTWEKGQLTFAGRMPDGVTGFGA